MNLTPMTEEELEIAVAVHARRRKVFIEEGLCEEQAWDLAEKMFERDRDIGDDRRVCFECKNHVLRALTAWADARNLPLTTSYQALTVRIGMHKIPVTPRRRTRPVAPITLPAWPAGRGCTSRRSSAA